MLELAKQSDNPKTKNNNFKNIENMRKLVSTFAAVALLFALNANANNTDPKAKKKKAKTEKSCSTEEKKACATGEKKAGCCASKKVEDKKS